MRKLSVLFLLVFALALGATAQVLPAMPDDPTVSAVLVDPGQSGALTEGGYMFGTADAVSVSEPFPEDDGPLPATPQEGEPAEASIYIGVMLLAIIGLLLTGLRRLNFTAKRQARTLLFQPPQAT
jgi:hypothetical protein